MSWISLTRLLGQFDAAPEESLLILVFLSKCGYIENDGDGKRKPDKMSPPKLTHVVSDEELDRRDFGEADCMDRRASPSSQVASKGMDDYINRRTMTPLQERMNGFTMLVGAFYGSYYCLSGTWLWDNIDQVDLLALSSSSISPDCGTSWLLQNLHATPPLPMIFIALGLVAHAPISFIYHWHYCTTLPPGKARFDHWSRKLDQAFIHVASAFVSYGTSGRWDFFAANVIFNAYCAWCTLVSTTVSIFMEISMKIRITSPCKHNYCSQTIHIFFALIITMQATPVKTQLCILLSMFFNTSPLLQRDDMDTFLLAWFVIGPAVWLFATYPIRGWSHAAFHLTIALLVPILMEAAGELPASQEQIAKAAHCASLLGKL